MVYHGTVRNTYVMLLCTVFIICRNSDTFVSFFNLRGTRGRITLLNLLFLEQRI